MSGLKIASYSVQLLSFSLFPPHSSSLVTLFVIGEKWVSTAFKVTAVCLKYLPALADMLNGRTGRHDIALPNSARYPDALPEKEFTDGNWKYLWICWKRRELGERHGNEV